MVTPWKLPEATLESSAAAAVWFGSLVYGWIVGGSFWFVLVFMNEPFGTWDRFGRIALVYLISWGLLAAVFVTLVFVALLWDYRRSCRFEHRMKVLALAAVPILIPYMTWLVVVAVVDLSDDLMSPGSILFNLDEHWWARLIVSGWWVPVFLLSWLMILVLSSLHADHLALERGFDSVCECGYDLRGNIAAGSDDCPECGREIPRLLRRRPRSIHVDR